ncbi:hypothetical protein ACJMK2_020373, partial [Sinanodonta woodiana]
MFKRTKSPPKPTCLPAGDALPIWESLPLDAKLPMLPNPKGTVILCTTKLGEPKYKKNPELDFSLSDPYGLYLFHEYEPLNDPHLKSFFSSPPMRRHLIRQKFITPEGKVLCTLQEFNQYRMYLRQIWLLEMAQREREKQRQITDRKEITLGRSDFSAKESKRSIIRERIEQHMKTESERIKNAFNWKYQRLEHRLAHLKKQSAARYEKRREETKKRQLEIAKFHEELRMQQDVAKRELRRRERRKSRHIAELQKLRVKDDSVKVTEMWNLRKRLQCEQIQKEAKMLQRDEETRLRNIERRERMIALQRARLEAKLDKLKMQSREEQKKKEDLYAKRLAKRLASGDFRIWSRKK